MHNQLCKFLMGFVLGYFIYTIFQEIVILKGQIKCKERHGRFYLVNVISKNSVKLEIKHNLLYSPFIIRRYGFHFRSTNLADKPLSKDSRSICKQTA